MCLLIQTLLPLSISISLSLSFLLVRNTAEYVQMQLHTQTPNREFLLRISYLEIYNENLADLLQTKDKIELKVAEHYERGVYVDGLMEVNVGSPEQVLECLQAGQSTLVGGGWVMSWLVGWFWLVVEWGEVRVLLNCLIQFCLTISSCWLVCFVCRLALFLRRSATHGLDIHER